MSKYKVSLYTSRAHLPFGFASHGWWVTNNNGVESRWEILFRKNVAESSWNHLQKNYLPATVGIEIIPYWLKYLWKGELLGSLEGDEGSLAENMVRFIENSPEAYPYRDRYFFLGPNSNTFPQWVLNQFPEFKVKLPWNAIGKNYHG